MIEQLISEELRPKLLAFLSNLELFHSLDRPTLEDLIVRMKILQVQGGDKIIQEGECDRVLYILWLGRLRVYKQGFGVAEVAAGEIVGEIALLTGAPRTATVEAIRDSLLIKLELEEFHYFERLHPAGVAQIAKKAISRLISSRQSQPGEKVVTLTAAPAGDSDPVAFLEHLTRALNQIGPTILINSALINQRFKEMDSLAIDQWLTSLEECYRFILYQTDSKLTYWTQRCLRQADMIFLVAEEGKNREINPIEEEIAKGRATKLLIFAHTSASAIKGTHLWHQMRPVDGYHHINLNEEKDFARLIRCMTGKAFGVVLNGGGMRGFAHIGVLKALEELKIPIDHIGGCSIGAAIGAAYARVGMKGAMEICFMKDLSRTSRDYTFPVVSLLRGKNVTHFFRKIYENDYIEDLKIPFYCVSTDLTEAKVHVHDRGRLWEAIRASTSIPAIYPPMYDEKGRMLVDGALLNNLPVDVMRNRLGGGRILAVDCNIEPLSQTKIIRQPWLSGWKLFFQQVFLAYKSQEKFNNIFKISYSALMLSSTRNEERAKQEADYLIEIETKRFGVLRLQEMDEIINLGYTSAMQQLPKQLKREQNTWNL